MWWHFISFEGRIHSTVGLPDGAGGKNLPANAEDSGDRDSIPGSGWEDPLEEEMATHSSTLATHSSTLAIPGSGWEDPLEEEMATHSSTHGEFHGQRSLVGYKEVGHERLSMHAIFHHMHVAQFAHSFCC